MRGRYYLKHTINHMVDNNQRIKNLNNNYKSVLINNAIEHLRKTDSTLYEKVNYLKELTHGVYRYGTKYKYNCNLSDSDIGMIIRCVQDDNLHQAYFGRTIKEDDSNKLVVSILILIGIGILCVLFSK